MSNQIGEVETRFFELPARRLPFLLRSGDRLEAVTVAYETYGELAPSRDNAILVFHALTGSQHAAGRNRAVAPVGEMWTEECWDGWWDGFIGPGKAVDTDRFFVICANYLGGCYGSTGPISRCPSNGSRYGATFPRVGFADTVDAHMALVDHLGIERLRAVIGASTGGYACLSLATRYPERVEIVVPIASGLSVTPLQRVHNFEQICAIEQDPAFSGGVYEPGTGPVSGMALARMIAHKSFVSLPALEPRSSLHPDERWWYEMTAPIESYMLYQGAKFVRRFDANAYLRIVDAWQRVDLFGDAGAGTVEGLFARSRNQRFLVFSIDSDHCFYPVEQQEMVDALTAAHVDVDWVMVHSDRGHDSFLLEPKLYEDALATALEGG